MNYQKANPEDFFFNFPIQNLYVMSVIKLAATATFF